MIRLPQFEFLGTLSKAVLRRRYSRDLSRFLRSNERIVLPHSPNPRVSVLIVLFNAAELSFRLFKSLAATLDIPAEVIVVDNNSSDRTLQLCARIDGVRFVRNEANLHFLRASNQIAALANGSNFLFLNSDVCLEAGAIRYAEESLDALPHAGAVGGRISLLDGALQEAGSIIWRDGACVGIGRGCAPEDASFQFRRTVDYCSGAFLMVRSVLFRALGGFDEAFAPAYYEETDLCMRLRDAGYSVVYDPRILVHHFEFGSATATNAAALQRRNRNLFVSKHKRTLEISHHTSKTPELEARMRDQAEGRILIIDDRLPYPSLGMGYPRAADLVRTIRDLGWFVTFFPMWHVDVDWAEAYDLWPRDIEILGGRGSAALSRTLRQRQSYYDLVLVSRPHNMLAFRNALRRAPAFLDHTRLIYDAEAIVTKRDELRRKVLNGSGSRGAHAGGIDAEMELTKNAVALIAVNDADAEIFRSATGKRTVVIGHALSPQPTRNSFEERSDILFVGALDDDDSPNVDSLMWFVREVMPRLDRLIGTDFALNIFGRNGSHRALALAGDRVRQFGQVHDLTDAYASAKLFIAPTRFAAGIPMKVHSAAAHGLPVVVTSILAQQLGWKHGAEILVADDPDGFARACATLYTDAALWARLRQRALEQVEADCDPKRFASNIIEVLSIAVQTELVAPPPPNSWRRRF